TGRGCRATAGRGVRARTTPGSSAARQRPRRRPRASRGEPSSLLRTGTTRAARWGDAVRYRCCPMPLSRPPALARVVVDKFGGSVLRRPEDIAEAVQVRSEEHTSELQSRGHLVCRLLLEKK